MPIYYYNPYEEQYAQYRHTMQMVMNAAMTMANQKAREKELEIQLKHDELQGQRRMQGEMLQAGYKYLGQKQEYFGKPTGDTRVVEGPYGGIYQEPELEIFKDWDKTPFGYKYGSHFGAIPERKEPKKEHFFVPQTGGGISLKGTEGEFGVGTFEPGQQPTGAIPFAAGAMGREEKVSPQGMTYTAKKNDRYGFPEGTIYYIEPKTNKPQVIMKAGEKDAISNKIDLAAKAVGIPPEKWRSGKITPEEANEIIKKLGEMDKDMMQLLLDRFGGGM